MNKLVLLIAISLSACATVNDGTGQMVKFNTVKNGKEVRAECTAQNKLSETNFKTPATAQIKRSVSSLVVNCKSGKLTGSAKIESGENPTIGSFGLLGVIADASTGAAFQYPDQVTVEME